MSTASEITIPPVKVRELPRGVKRRGSKFTARIVLNRSRVWLGTFDTAADASKAYEAARAAAIVAGNYEPDRQAMVTPGGFVEIPLAKNRGTSIVDNVPAILEVVLARKWSVGKKGYAVANPRGGTKLLHRIVWKITHGTVPVELDHINQNRLDNRLENLRPASRSLQARNAGKHRGELPMGVVANCGRFRAHATVSSAVVHLGYYDTPDEAADVAAVARERLIAIEADRASRGLAFASDEMPPAPRTRARREWKDRWRAILLPLACPIRSQGILTASDIPGIRRRLAAGESQKSIGRSLGVSNSAISAIARGKRWAHIPPDPAGVTVVSIRPDRQGMNVRQLELFAGK